MQTVEVKLDREQARELYRDYRKHQHYSTPVDLEIQRTYQLIAQGRMVIQALESIRLAGLDEQGFPKLAIARADQRATFVDIGWNNGSVTMGPHERSWQNNPLHTSLCFEWKDGSAFGEKDHRGKHGEALLPLIPLHLRPKRAIQNYHILWEAEWTRIVPRDPFLLRRIGKGDLWLVCAHWDLTEVERAALATRVASA